MVWPCLAGVAQHFNTQTEGRTRLQDLRHAKTKTGHAYKGRMHFRLYNN